MPMRTFQTFADYVLWREGLWMNDDNAIVGLSKLPRPKPPKKQKPPPQPKLNAPKQIRVAKVVMPKFGSKTSGVGTPGRSPTSGT